MLATENTTGALRMAADDSKRRSLTQDVDIVEDAISVQGFNEPAIRQTGYLDCLMEGQREND
jgi:hypothetical protein